jgi:tellurite resistance protein
MSGILSGLIRGYQEQLRRHRNRPFLRAAMAACALVSMAGGVVSLRQRVQMDQIMETLDGLKVFDPHEGVDLFNDFVESIAADPVSGHAQALAVVDEEVAEEPEKAQLLIRICAAVVEQEGTAAEQEWKEIRTLCDRFALEPEECGLDSVRRRTT